MKVQPIFKNMNSKVLGGPIPLGVSFLVNLYKIKEGTQKVHNKSSQIVITNKDQINLQLCKINVPRLI